MFMTMVQQAQARGETMVHFHLDTNETSTMMASTPESQAALAAAMAGAADE